MSGEFSGKQTYPRRQPTLTSLVDLDLNLDKYTNIRSKVNISSSSRPVGMLAMQLSHQQHGISFCKFNAQCQADSLQISIRRWSFKIFKQLGRQHF